MRHRNGSTPSTSSFVAGRVLVAVGVAVLMAGVVPLPAGGTATASAAAGQGAAPVLALEQAVALAARQGATLVLARFDLDSARIAYERAVASSVLSPAPFAEQTARHDLARSENQYRAAWLQAITTAIGAYLDVLAADLAGESSRLAVDNARASLDAVKRKASTGTASSLDVAQAEQQLESAEIERDGAVIDREEALAALAQAIGVTADKVGPLDKAAADELPPLPAGSLDELVARAIAADRDLAWRRESLEIARKQLEQAKLEDAAPLDLRARELAVSRAQVDLDQATTKARQDAASAYGSLAIAHRRAELSRQSLALEQQKLAAVEQQQKLGLKTPQDVAAARISLLKAQQNYLSAAKGYLTALVQFRHRMGEPLGFGVPEEQEKQP